MAARRFTRTHDGGTEEALVLVWNGVRIQRGTSSPDGPQGSFEVLQLQGAEADAEAERRIAALLEEGFHELLEAPALRPKPKPKPRAPLPPSKPLATPDPPAWVARSQPPLDKQMSKVRSRIRKAGLAHRGAEIEALVRPALAFQSKKAKSADFEQVVSRIGGDPDLPPNTPWPTLNGVALTFVAQIAITQIKELDLENALPARGVLAFFAQLDPEQSEYGEAGIVLHLPESEDLVRAQPPKGAQRIGQAALLTPKLRLTVPPGETPPVERLALNVDEADAYHDGVFLDLIPEGRHHLVLGWPTAATRLGIEGRRFLAQIDSDHRIGFRMGDFETLRFYMGDDEIHAESLEGATCTLSEA